MRVLVRNVGAFLVLAGVCVAGSAGAQAEQAGGAVFTLTNEAAGNHVIAFARAPDGSLSEGVPYATAGGGTDDSLGSQGALVLTHDHRFLLAVNAGTNEVSVFAVHGAELELTDTVASGGTRPISVSEQHGIVYVLNAGGTGNVAGFTLGCHGTLELMADGVHALSGAATNPAQVEISPNGKVLAVTERATNRVVTYPLDHHGHAGTPHVTPSAGPTPFGFAFTQHGELLVSEAERSSVSAYDVAKDGALTVLSEAVPNTQAAACWLAVSHDQQFAFTANAGSSSISSYVIEPSGAVELSLAVAGDVGPGSRPLDLALDQSGHSLYVVDRGNAGVAAFEVAGDGSLDMIDFEGSLPPFASGVAAY